MNEAETAFALWAESQGWIVSKRGWPDFICRRGDDEIMAVEVKYTDTLSNEQRGVATCLAAHGLPAFIWWYQDEQLVPISPAAVSHLAPGDLNAIELADRLQAEADSMKASLATQDRRQRLLAIERTAKAEAQKQEIRELRAQVDRLTDDIGYLLRNAHPVYTSDRIKRLKRRLKLGDDGWPLSISAEVAS